MLDLTAQHFPSFSRSTIQVQIWYRDALNTMRLCTSASMIGTHMHRDLDPVREAPWASCRNAVPANVRRLKTTCMQHGATILDSFKAGSQVRYC